MRALFIALVLSTLSGCYYIQQGVRLADIYSKAMPVGAALSDEELPEDERNLILLVSEVKAFAVRELGLADNGNYTSYIRTGSTYLADVVSACKDDSFDQYMFEYLLVGRLPYKGFFKHEEAMKEANELASKGYDVLVRKVEAFSTIGILEDPIMSFMKTSSQFRVAEVIVHEQLHATVFMTDYPQASENFATFVGEEGALEFLKRKYGESSDELAKYAALESDSNTFNRLLRELYETLTLVYKGDGSRSEKLELKAKAIERWKADISTNYARLFKTTGYGFISDAKIDNAYITTNLNYTRNLELYERLFRKVGSIREMVAFVKRIVEDRSVNPESAISDYLANNESNPGSR